MRYLLLLAEITSFSVEVIAQLLAFIWPTLEFQIESWGEKSFLFSPLDNHVVYRSILLFDMQMCRYVFLSHFDFSKWRSVMLNIKQCFELNVFLICHRIY